MGCVVVDLNNGVSVTAVAPAAWADSDKATRPVAPRSALRKNDFIIVTSLVDSADLDLGTGRAFVKVPGRDDSTKEPAPEGPP